jgi:hypothetical protein
MDTIPLGLGNANHKKGKTHHLIPLKTAKNPKRQKTGRGEGEGKTLKG